MPKKEKKNCFIIELKLNTTIAEESILNKRFEISRGIYNKTLKYAIKQLKRLNENKTYKNILKDYLKYKESEDKENTKLYSSLLTEIRNSYNLSEYGLHSFVKVQQKLYKKHIDSFTSQKLASTVWKGVETVLFKEGQKLHFKKYNELTSVEGKSNKTGIRLLNNNLSWNGLIIPVKIRKNDLFVQESLERNIKYCRIVRKPIKNKFKFYVQLVLEGTPPVKRVNSNGEFRYSATLKNSVGIDIGTSTIAVASKDAILLEELSKNSKIYNNDIIKLQKKIERSKRATNPLNFNLDGTIKKGIKLTWKYSKNYYKLLFKLKDLYRRKSHYMKMEHNKLANKIISLGTTIYVETMSFKGLQKRAKETTINEKTGKINKKKRFGGSLNNKAPSMLLEIIDRKLKYIGSNLIKINTTTFRASQYNHFEDKYIKKDINQRWNTINKEEIQRDLYSAFLIMNSKEDLTQTDREKCLKTYENFKLKHNKLIETIKKDKIKYPTSFGIKKIG